jgi:acyl-CoA hydrolase
LKTPSVILLRLSLVFEKDSFKVLDMTKSLPTDHSIVTANYIVMPNHANPSGSAFGGTIISWIDICAAMVAQKHASSDVVTVHIDEIYLKAPVVVGDHVLVKGSIQWCGKTSMIISVEVYGSNPITQSGNHVTTAVLTMVAIDQFKKPKKVPSLEIKSSSEQEAFDFFAAKKR